jgi:hypothetical protein
MINRRILDEDNERILVIRHVGCEVFTAVTMNNAVFWDVLAASQFLTLFLARGFLYSEDGSDMLLRNVGSRKIYTTSQPRRPHSSFSSSSYYYFVCTRTLNRKTGWPIEEQINLRGLNPRANYTNRATVACRRR